MGKPIVINLFAGPGTGKSTSCAQIFAELKHQGINCEMVREFAKDKVWENSLDVLNDQIYIFGKQQHRMKILVEQVDVIITDSPLLLSIVYDKSNNQNFKNLVVDTYNEFKNINIFLVREKPYNPKGRIQNEEKAKLLDIEIKSLLTELNIPHFCIKSNRESIIDLSKKILTSLKKNEE
jgi:nicotinamide riboside kinase